MLTLQNVGSSRDAGHYYEKADDYYTKDQSPSQWQGKGAEALALSGEVNIEAFKALLDGNLPNGETIKAGGEGRRGGTDLTFSAPKSLSMQAFIGGDLHLIDAHDRAVARTLEYAETLVSYRQMKEGGTQSISSQNFVAATFRHELSRACDPQLHTHCVVLNMTQREDGKWRALDNEQLYRQKMLMGAFYRAELARKVQKLGYEIRITRADGLFELAHFTDQQLDQFSKRSQVIEEALAKNGKTRETATAQEKQIIAIATRPKKTEVDRKVLKEYWNEKSRDFEIDYQSTLKPRSEDYFNRWETVETVHFGVNHLIERQSAFTESQLFREALQFGVGKATYSEIKSEIERRVKTGLLLRSERIREAGKEIYYTTPEAIQREKAILHIEKRGRGMTRSVLETREAELRLKDRGLNDGQQQAAKLLLTTEDRIVGVQGLAGTGKTFMLETVKELAEEKGYQLVGLAPSASAAQELLKSGIASQTIASFQATQDKDLNSKNILVMDEAGMISSKQMEALLKIAQKNHSKVFLIGDTQQLKAVEAGKPFAQLQNNGMATAGMSEIQRQKNPELKRAVEFAARSQIPESMVLLQKHILEIKDAKQRYEKIATEYAALSPSEREKTLIVSGTNEARRSINEKVREKLNLQGKGIEVKILEKRDLTQAQIKQVQNYRKGDWIQTERNYNSLGLKKGELCQIREIKKNSIVLEKADGSSLRWEPHLKNKVSVYTLEKREVAVGEIIRITQNYRQKGLNNGDRGKVIQIDPHQKTFHLQREDGKRFQVDASKPLHLEHGYCSTVHSAQGKTCERVFIETDTKSLTSARDTYYVAISRARQEARIYTDNKEKIPKAMGRENIKETAMELGNKNSERQKVIFKKSDTLIAKVKTKKQSERIFELDRN